MKKIISLLLVLTLVAACLVPVVYAVSDEDNFVVGDPSEKEFRLDEFNESVNAIKTVMPSCKMVSSYTLAPPTVGSIDGEVLDDSAQKWIKWIVDAFFKDGAGLANTLFSTIFADTAQPVSQSFLYGEKRDNRVPLIGKPYVSALTAEDDFTMTVSRSGGTKLRPENTLTYTRILFPDVSVDEVGNSSLSKIFDLSSASLNPIIVSNPDGIITPSGKSSLDDVKLNGFTFTSPTAEAVYDANGNLVVYATDIDYCFDLSLYDFIRLISIITKFDYMAAVTGIANVILENDGRGTLAPDEILRTRHMYITYNIRIELSDFDFDRRAFGDINNDGTVTIDDARVALRHAIGIQNIRNATALIYSDVDFNGGVDISDARLILRTAIGLDAAFTYVPEGKEITIVEVYEPETRQDEPVTRPDPAEEPTTGDGGSTSGMTDIGEEAAAFVQSIYDIVNALRETENFSQNTISDLIKYFQGLKED